MKTLFNGNIAETYWKTANDDLNRGYAYQYDNLNRLKAAIYQKAGTATNAYNESLTYDKNGNILSLNRNGTSETVTAIDNLAYTYSNNQLLKVADTSNKTQGFVDGTNTDNDFTYDANGNMTIDKNKGITAIAYNHLNLPIKITFGTTGNIVYVYNATGQKLKKVVTQVTTVTTTDYLGGYQYVNNTLQFFPTAEGYVGLSGTTYSYTYQYKDHLGNIRLSYSDANNDKLITNNEIVEESNYYPFGLKQTGYNNVTNSLGNSSAQKYKYNGKELQDELGLNMYDYGARNYDATIGRWMNVDPLAETSRRWTPYNYAYNNPIIYIDPDGQESTLAAMANYSSNLINKWEGQAQEKAEQQREEKEGDPTKNTQISNANSSKNANRFKKVDRHRADGSVYRHTGLDIKTKNGDNIYSIKEGIVVGKIDTFKPNQYKKISLGNTITIKSELGNGEVIYILYAHLNNVADYKIGEKVGENFKIGEAGATGNPGRKSNGSWGIDPNDRHVHIEASKDGVFYGGKNRVSVEDYIDTKFDSNGNYIEGTATKVPFTDELTKK